MSSRTSTTDDLSIKIGKFLFTLKAYNPKAYDRRGLLLIESKNVDTNEKIPVCLYKSNSDLGFWRLCYTKSADSDILEKGDTAKLHYVMTTFIHIDLQLFINRNLASVNIDESLNDCFTPYSDEGVFEKVDEEIFTRTGISAKINDIGIHAREILNPFTGEEFEPDQIIPFKMGRGPVYKVKKSLVVSYFGYCGKSFYSKKTLNGSNFLEENYVPVTESMTKLEDYNFNHNDGEDFNIELISELFSVDLKKTTDIELPDLKLYFLNIQSVKVNDFSEEEIFYPVFIGPRKNGINEFGLFNEYFDIGYYVCKILDYTDRCRGTVCTKKYSFQKHYSDYKSEPLFPFNLLFNVTGARPLHQEAKKTFLKEQISQLEGIEIHLKRGKKDLKEKIDDALWKTGFAPPDAPPIENLDSKIEEYTTLRKQLESSGVGKKKSKTKKNQKKKKGVIKNKGSMKKKRSIRKKGIGSKMRIGSKTRIGSKKRVGNKKRRSGKKK